MPLALPHRILLIQLRRLGDVVLSTALLEDLRRAVPDAGIDWLVGPAAAPLLAGHPLLHERIVYDPDRAAAMRREVRVRRYDWVVDLQGNLRTALVARASGARARVGWRIRAWRLFYTHAEPRGGRTEYVVRTRQRLLERLGVAPGPSRPRIHLAEDELEQGERDARSAGAPPGAPRVGMLLSTREAVKDWRPDAFGELAARLQRTGVVPLIFQVPGDEARTARVRERTPGAVFVPPLELRRFLGVLTTCRVFVSGDTGPAHMADALDVPRVTIFGATNPRSWCPVLPTTIALVGPDAQVIPMRARTRAAASGGDLTAGVSPEMVFEAVEQLLARADAGAMAARPAS